MAKEMTVYRCQECGNAERKWLGRCPSCQAWSSLVEERSSRPSGSGKALGRPQGARPAAKAIPITQVVGEEVPRRPLGLGELDRVLGGGLVRGSLVLIGGEPGVGKSTLLLSVAKLLADLGLVTLYVSAEESLAQTRMRAERLNALSDKLLLLAETDLALIEGEMEVHKPAALILDSVQTVYAPELESAPGSVGQVREVTSRMMHLAKVRGVSTFLVGHVTKDGAIAGPKTLEHMVDTVLSFEGTRSGPYRLLRATKNRFGSTNEIAVFEMRGEGLREVDNPSALFLAERPESAPGSAVTAALEGTRPILVEVQGLCVSTPFGNPRRTTVGIDSTRCAVIAAVLERRCGLSLAGQDVFVNVAGGVTLTETAADLPVALALASSLKNRPVPQDLVCFGEVGLSGEVRAVQRADARLYEASRLGFKRALLAASSLEHAETPKGMTLLPVKTLEQALEACFD
jgi:DNA repair protein RadA/Sms